MSRYLILCYAVECGLKQHLMRERNLLDTEQLDSSELGLHHDLARYLKAARLPAQATAPALVLADVKAKHRPPCRPNLQVQPHQYHEAFRYSIELAAESHLIEQLERVLTALEAS